MPLLPGKRIINQLLNLPDRCIYLTFKPLVTRSLYPGDLYTNDSDSDDCSSDDLVVSQYRE